MNDAAEPVTSVWIAPADSVGAREDAVKSLGEWARARGLVLVPAEGGAAHPTIPVDAAVPEKVERELDRAKEAISALDADTAERALARAEAMLRDHPELPQGAWLRAEVLRAWAMRLVRVEPKDEARARAAWQDADALDGGRVAGIGETAFPKRPPAPLKIVVRGSGARNASVRLDGVVLVPKATDERSATYVLDVVPAEHQLVAAQGGEITFASWVVVAAGGAPVELHLEGGGRCDAPAFASVAREGDHVDAHGVSCARWVAAVPGEKKGSVLVARCELDACGPLLEWRTAPLGPTMPEEPARGPGWPKWATWALVGAGALTAGSIAIVASGALESRPNETRFVSGGVRTQSHR